MGIFRRFLVSSVAVLGVAAAGAAWAAPHVVVSIKPVHSLVAGVMTGVGTPRLLVEGAGSPHAYTLKPSQAAAIEQADIIFWVGHAMEPFLEKPLETLGANATVVALIDTDGLILLPLREGGAFEVHGHDGEEDHVGEAAADGDHDDEASDEAAHHDAEDSDGEFNMHVWLDPENAKAMVAAIEAALSAADPDNAAAYRANADALATRLDGLGVEINAVVAPVRGQSFVVFHDAYQYFEERFGVAAAGSITVSPEVMPGAERVAEIRAKVAELGATCVFSEPQFEPKLVSVVTEGTQARSGVLDPLGAAIDDGPDLYFTLTRKMADAVRDCLSPES